MKTLLLILAVSFLALTGCRHAPVPTFVVREVPVQVTSTNTLDVIRFPSSYRAYTVGRRIDPAHPGFMQESHVLYVREAPDRWNLQPPAAPSPPPVLSTAPVDAAFVPLPLDQQLRTELQEQRRASQALHEQAQRFQQAADVFVPTARKAVELSNQIDQRQQLLEDRLRRLEEGQRWSSFTNWPASTNRAVVR